MSVSSCVYLSRMWGTGVDQEAVDLQGLLLLIPGEGRQWENVQPRQMEAVEAMSTQGWCSCPCPVNVCGCQAGVTTSTRSLSCEGHLWREQRSVSWLPVHVLACAASLIWGGRAGALQVHPPACCCADAPVLAPIPEQSTHLLALNVPGRLGDWEWHPYLVENLHLLLKSIPKLEFTASICELDNTSFWDCGDQTGDQLIAHGLRDDGSECSLQACCYSSATRR